MAEDSDETSKKINNFCLSFYFQVIPKKRQLGNVDLKSLLA